MSTIRIAEGPHPARSNANTSGSGLNAVVQMRRLSKTQSFDRRSFTSSYDAEDDEDADLRRSQDFPVKQTFRGKLLLWLAYQSIGVIYGDIGTSPLYVYSSTFTGPPSYHDLVGVLSLIIWSLIMMVTLKYVIVILHADNEGEGGTFSTYALLCRYANLSNRDPREGQLLRMERHMTGDLGKGGGKVRNIFERSKFARIVLKVMGVLAVTMVLADGVLTPAQSVLGAVQGLNVAVPTISHSTVVGATCGILIFLFAIQPLGVSKLASGFAPIVIIWLAFNAAFGIYNLALFDHSVLKAFNPGEAFLYLIRNGEKGWRSLGGILLAFTGVEALFADLGAFSMRAIQLSWLCYTFPCLLLAYSGQAAYISVHPDAYSNPFFNSCPPGMVIPSLVVAILAAIVASQAIITASFQLVTQIQKLSYFPQIKVVHVSKIYHGQVYVPLANWLLMIGTVLIAGIFNNTTALGNAYGVCVIFVTFFDTCMVSLTAILVWKYSPLLVFLPWLTFALMDGTFLSSALTKVPSGAWFTILLASLLACILLEWRFGKEQQWAAEAADRHPTSHFIKRRRDNRLQLTERYGGTILSPISGLGVFFDKSGETAPLVFSAFVSKLVAVPEVMIFFHMRALERPSVAEEERYHVTRLGIPNCYRLVLRHGFNDRVVTEDLAAVIYDVVRRYISSGPPPRPTINLGEESDNGITNGIDPHASSTGLDLAAADDESTAISTNVNADYKPQSQASKTGVTHTSTPTTSRAESEAQRSADIARLDAAYAHQILYIIGKEEMKVKPGTNFVRATLLKAFLWMRENSRTKVADLRVPGDRVIEVGFVKEV